MKRLRLPPALLGALPWMALMTVVLLNVYQGLWAYRHNRQAVAEVWHGPLMPGKPLAMAERPRKEVEMPAEEKIPFQDEPLRDMVIKEPETEGIIQTGVDKAVEKSFASVAAKKAVVKSAKAAEGREAPRTPVANRNLESGFIVQVGDFVLKLGTDTLVKRLKDHGMEPVVESEVDMVLLNNVQAGPYAKLEQAKESEVKMKAAGQEATVSETWEGHVVSLGKFYLLGYAMQTMEYAERLQVKPVRIIKVEVPLEVQKVFVGPFATRDKAKEVSARIAQLGLAVPVIKEWKAKTKADAPSKPAEAVAGNGKGSRGR